MITNEDIQNLIKAQKEVFVTKEEFKGLIDIVATKDGLKNFATKENLNVLMENVATKDDLENIREDVKTFKTEILTGQAEILLEIKSLKGEKSLGDTQDTRKQKVLEIHNEALKRNKILSDVEVLDISKLHAF